MNADKEIFQYLEILCILHHDSFGSFPLGFKKVLTPINSLSLIVLWKLLEKVTATCDTFKLQLLFLK